MRKAVKPTSQSPADVLPKKGEAKKTKTQLKIEPKKNPDPMKPGINTIIEEKPKRKAVVEFLQERANELTLEKMK